MRIVVPTVDYPPIEGGISTVALNLSRELAALGHEVTVVAPHFPGMEQFDAGEPVRVLRFRGYGLGWPRLLPLLWRTWPHVRQADLIMGINVSYGGVIGRLAGALPGKRYVAFAYAYEFMKYRRHGMVAAVLKSVYYNAVTTVAISRYTARALEEFGIPATMVTIILPGAPIAAPRGISAVAEVRHRLELGEDRFILSVGRFIPRKGQLHLVRAMPRILEACPNTRLVFVGRGPELQACRDKARSLAIEGWVHFAGYLDDGALTALYQDCALFVLPTGTDTNGQVEGFGLVFAEAHAHGKAVVAGRSGGVSDAVLHGKTGLVVAGDQPDRVADGVIDLLCDPDKARRMGEAGRKRVEEELNWKVFTEKLLDSVGDTP